MGVWKEAGFEKFGVGARVLYFHRDYLSRNEMDNADREQLLTYDFVVTTYDVVTYAAPKHLKDTRPRLNSLEASDVDDARFTGRAALFYTPWERVVADESQRFANPKTQVYKAVMCLFGHSKLCLTGTPIRNYSTDLWAQLRFCGYAGTMSESAWKRSFGVITKNHRLLDVVLTQGHDVSGVALPEKHVHAQYVVLDGTHRTVYDYVLGVVQGVYDEMLAAKVSMMRILALFTLLRLCCIAPHLLTDESKRLKDSTQRDLGVARQRLTNIYDRSYPLWDWVRERFAQAGVSSPKVARTVELIDGTDPEEKVIVFSMFTCALDLVRDALEEREKTWGGQKRDALRVLQLDGDTPAGERPALLNTFRSDKDAKVLLITYKTGGEGIDVTCANQIIELDPWWTDSVHRQAEARVWRAGQTRDVHVHRLFVKNSIEERVLEICQMKNEMIQRIFGDEPSEGPGGLNMAALGFLIGRGTSLKAPKRLRKGNRRDQAALRSARLRYFENKASDGEMQGGSGNPSGE